MFPRQMLRSAGPMNQRLRDNIPPKQNNNFMGQTMTSGFNTSFSGGMEATSSKSKLRLYNAIHSPHRFKGNQSQKELTVDMSQMATHTYSQHRDNKHFTRTPSQDQFRLMDREQLQYEQMTTKLENKDLEKQVKMLKAKVQMLYQELSKKDRLIEQFISSSVPDKQIQDTCIINAYKSQIMELKRKIEVMGEQNQQLQRALPYTQIKELQVEIETYQDECKRLKAKLDVYLTNNEIKTYFEQPSWRDVTSNASQDIKQKDKALEAQQQEIDQLKIALLDSQQSNQELIKKLNEMAVDQHKLKSKKKKVQLDLDSNDLKLKIADLERINTDYKQELQKYYMPKIIHVMQTLALQKNEDIQISTKDVKQVKETLEQYLPLSEHLIDHLFIEQHQNQLKFYSKEALMENKDTIQTLITQLDHTYKRLVDISNLSAKTDNIQIQNFLRYLGQISLQSESYITMEIIDAFFNEKISNNQMQDEDEQLLQIKNMIESLDLTKVKSVLMATHDQSVIDKGTFLKILDIQHESDSVKKLLHLLQVKSEVVELISLSEFKQIVEDKINEVKGNDEKVKSNDSDTALLVKRLMREHFKQTLSKHCQKIVVQLGTRQKSMDYLCESALRGVISEIVQKSDHMQLETDILDKLIEEMRLSDKRPEVLVFKKLEQLLNQ